VPITTVADGPPDGEEPEVPDVEELLDELPQALRTAIDARASAAPEQTRKFFTDPSSSKGRGDRPPL
jgi:hypothetical protein